MRNNIATFINQLTREDICLLNKSEMASKYGEILKVNILLLTKQNMLNLLSNDSILLSNFSSSFANRVLLLNLKTELLSYSSIQQKIAFSLLHLMDEYRHNNVITLPFSKKTWSEHLNVSRPSLFRELKMLSNQKTIHLQNRTITILNEDDLMNLLNN